MEEKKEEPNKELDEDMKNLSLNVPTLNFCEYRNIEILRNSNLK